MKRSTITTTILVLLFALAVLFGLAQRKTDPYTFHDYTLDAGNSETQNELKGLYNKGKTLSQEDPTKDTVAFLAVGDIMLSRNVAGTALKTNNPLLPFSNMKDVFASVDFSFANLESPFSGSDAFNPSGSLVFNAPRSMVQGLTEHNFKIVSLANNHALDQGEKGIDYTLQYLKENGIQHVGVGKSLDQAWSPEIVETNGIRIGFVGVSYASINDNGRTDNEFVARMEDTQRLKSVIDFLKTQSDYIIVAMHAGTEYTTHPNQLQIDFAHAAIDAGADMVIGHHPHWVQTIESYCPRSGFIENSSSPETEATPPTSPCANPKYIFYSLGNFIFDQEWSRETKEGLALKIQLTKNKTSKLQGPKLPAQLEQIELLPVIIENYSTPRLANTDEAKRILDRIGQTSTILK